MLEFGVVAAGELERVGEGVAQLVRVNALDARLVAAAPEHLGDARTREAATRLMLGTEGSAPLVAPVRADGAVTQLARQVHDLHPRIDDLRVRMVDAADGALECLVCKG